MNAIVKRCKLKRDKATGKPRPRSARTTLAYVYREAAKANKGDVLAIEGKLPGGGVISGNAQLDAIALASRAPAGKSEVGHYVISAKGAASPELTRMLLRSGHAFARKYLGARGYVIAVHDNHGHVITEMYDDKGRALYIDDDTFERMKRLEFTTEFEANDQTPNPNRPKFDPKAQGAQARALALRLVDGKTSWETLLKTGEITPARVNDRGEVMSFTCRHGDREIRLRVSTVEAFVERERKRRVQVQAKAKAAALGEHAKNIMSKGLDRLLDEIEEVAHGEPTQTPTRGRAR